LLSGRDFFRIRYFIILNPLILWVFAIGIQQMRMRYQICAALVFASFFAKGYAYVNPPWREAAHTVIESQGHAILTSRSIALEMPYYIGHQVNIHQIKSTSKPIEQLDQLLRTNDKVWIVDSALSSRAYLDELLNLAPAHQMKINFNQTFTNGAEDSVVAVEITR
jgi:hypothetical protein